MNNIGGGPHGKGVDKKKFKQKPHEKTTGEI